MRLGSQRLVFSVPVQGSSEHLCPQYGDAFTLSLAGRKMTFLFHPEALRHFFAAPTCEIAFRSEALSHRYGMQCGFSMPFHKKCFGVTVPVCCSYM